MKVKSEVEFYSSVKEVELKWLWYPYIPLGKITLLQGDPGDGKSLFMMYLTACITNGDSLPDGAALTENHTVIYQCSEDGTTDTIKPRLVSARADCDKVAFIPEEGEPLTIEDARIENAIRETGAKLIIFDPIQAYIPPDSDMLNAVKMRATMRRLSRLAEKYNCAVVLVGHMTKSNEKKNLYRGLGSIDIAAVARSVLMIERDERNPSIRYIFPVKSNLATEGSAIKFMIDKDLGFHILGRCDYPQKPTLNGTRKRNKSYRAEELLRLLLAGDSKPSKFILEQIEKAGVSERTIRSVAKNIGITAYRKDNIWYWTLQE